MFLVAAQLIFKKKIVLFAFFYTKIHCLTGEFHGKFHAKDRYRRNHEAMSGISVFRVTFTLEFNLELNFS